MANRAGRLGATPLTRHLPVPTEGTAATGETPDSIKNTVTQTRIATDIGTNKQVKVDKVNFGKVDSSNLSFSEIVKSFAGKTPTEMFSFLRSNTDSKGVSLLLLHLATTQTQDSVIESMRLLPQSSLDSLLQSDKIYFKDGTANGLLSYLDMMGRIDLTKTIRNKLANISYADVGTQTARNARKSHHRHDGNSPGTSNADRGMLSGRSAFEYIRMLQNDEPGLLDYLRHLCDRKTGRQSTLLSLLSNEDTRGPLLEIIQKMPQSEFVEFAKNANVTFRGKEVNLNAHLEANGTYPEIFRKAKGIEYKDSGVQTDAGVRTHVKKVRHRRPTAKAQPRASQASAPAVEKPSNLHVTLGPLPEQRTLKREPESALQARRSEIQHITTNPPETFRRNQLKPVNDGGSRIGQEYVMLVEDNGRGEVALVPVESQGDGTLRRTGFVLWTDLRGQLDYNIVGKM